MDQITLTSGVVMALTLDGLIFGSTANDVVYYTPGFLRTCESLLPQLRAAPNNTVLTIEPTLGNRYQGDFYGMLTASRIPPKYHWITMRVNDIDAPDQYDGTQLDFILPDYSTVESQMVMYKTLYRNAI